jgi:hypothetical protein
MKTDSVLVFAARLTLAGLAGAVCSFVAGALFLDLSNPCLIGEPVVGCDREWGAPWILPAALGPKGGSKSLRSWRWRESNPRA